MNPIEDHYPRAYPNLKKYVHYEKPLQSAEAAKSAWDKAEAKRQRKQAKRIAS